MQAEIDQLKIQLEELSRKVAAEASHTGVSDVIIDCIVNSMYPRL